VKILKGYNIGWDVVGKRCVTTAMIPNYSLYGDIPTETFETLVWEWDEKEQQRGKILEQIHHRSGEEAEKVHHYIVNNFKAIMS
jgi:hypothetical protein